HSPAVVEEVLRQGADEGMGRLKPAQVTVLFADLVGFTPFAESAGPEKVADSLDAFLNLAVEAIFRAGGTLDKFIGDCVMAFFGAPVPLEDHALRAVRAAVQLQDHMRLWNAGQGRSREAKVLLRIGINSGPALVGELGSDRRVDYTVLGSTVNIA